MKGDFKMLKRLWKEEDGQGLVEYGLIIALIALALVAALGLLKDDIVALFGTIGDKLNP
jgi:pilus assembly protein Flp/PilA